MKLNNIKLKILTLSGLLLVFIGFVNKVYAVHDDILFRSDKIIRMELRADFSAIELERRGTPQYHPGELVVSNSGGKRVWLPVEVMARGNFRLNPDNCDFPPLFVNFKEEDVKHTIFENQNEIKLVTPCQSDEYVIEEYLIYKMYNKVTDLSLNVRLVKINYFDTGTNKSLFEKYSFFLEDKDLFEKRTDAVEIERFLTPYDLNKESFIKMSFFQYIIGNQDWFITSGKNIILMQPNDSTLKPYSVAYDFDFTDFVNAEYTRPPGLSDSLFNRQRLYKGLCLTTNEIINTIEFFNKLRPSFASIIDNKKLLPKETREKLLNYIDEYYKLAEDEGLLISVFQNDCLTEDEYYFADQ